MKKYLEQLEKEKEVTQHEKSESKAEVTQHKFKNLSDAEIESQITGKPIKVKQQTTGDKYTVNWNTKAHGLKYKDYTDKEKAWKAWRSHSNQDSILWKEDKEGNTDHFRVSWIHKWGDMKTEAEIKEEFYKFLNK